MTTRRKAAAAALVLLALAGCNDKTTSGETTRAPLAPGSSAPVEAPADPPAGY